MFAYSFLWLLDWFFTGLAIVLLLLLFVGVIFILYEKEKK